MMDKYFLNKELVREIGFQFWLMHQEKQEKLEDVARKTHIPAYKIDLIELGKRFHLCDYRKLTEFYGKKMKISFE